MNDETLLALVTAILTAGDYAHGTYGGTESNLTTAEVIIKKADERMAERRKTALVAMAEFKRSGRVPETGIELQQYLGTIPEKWDFGL